MTMFENQQTELQNNGRSLERLSISPIPNELSAEEALKLIGIAAKYTGNLTELTIRGISNEANHHLLIINLVEVNPNLQTLDLGDCKLSNNQLKAIFTELKFHTKLERLLLQGNNMTHPSLNGLENVLLNSPINNLILGGNLLDSQAINSLILILDKEPIRSRLESLSLSGNPIGEAGAIIVLRWLKPTSTRKAPALRSLYLKAVGLTDAGINEIASLLTYNNSPLTVLAIESNKLVEKHLRLLTEKLPAKTNLAQLSWDNEYFNSNVVLSLLTNPKANTIAIRKLKRQAKEYFCQQGQLAILANKPVEAEVYFKNALTVVPNDSEATKGWDDSHFLRLIAEFTIQLQKKNFKQIAQQLQIEYQQLQKRWQEYIKEAPKLDAIELNEEGRYLRQYTYRLQRIIHWFLSPTKDYIKLYPLWQAIDEGNNKEISQLVSQGFQLNVPDFEGEVAMHRAARLGNLMFIDFLLSLGAKANIINKTNQYPWQCVSAKDENIAKQLQNKLITMQNEHNKGEEIKAFRLIPHLYAAINVENESSLTSTLRKKLQAIEDDLKVLVQVYRRALEARPEMGAVFNAYYNDYSQAYDPILKGTPRPKCFTDDTGYLKELESQLLRECRELAITISQDDKDKQILGFYNQIAKCLADLIVLKELTEEHLAAAHYFYKHGFFPDKNAMLGSSLDTASAINPFTLEVITPSAIQSNSDFNIGAGNQFNEKKLIAIQKVSLSSYSSPLFTSTNTKGEQAAYYRRCVGTICDFLQNPDLRIQLQDRYEDILRTWDIKIAELSSGLSNQAITNKQLEELPELEKFIEWLATLQSDPLIYKK